MSKIPKFKTEKEEKEFWLSHDATEYFEEIEDVKKTCLLYTSPSPRD